MKRKRHKIIRLEKSNKMHHLSNREGAKMLKAVKCENDVTNTSDYARNICNGKSVEVVRHPLNSMVKNSIGRVLMAKVLGCSGIQSISNIGRDLLDSTKY